MASGKTALLSSAPSSRADLGLLAIRIGLGLMFMAHGMPKLLAGPEGWERLGHAMSHLGIDAFPTFWGGMAAVAEGIGGLALLLGLFTRPFLFLMLCTMIVAATQHISNGEGFKAASHAMEMGTVFFGLLI